MIDDPTSRELEHKDLRESAVDVISASAAVVSAATGVASYARSRRDRGQDARQQAMIEAALARQQRYDPGFSPDADYDPGFGERPIDLDDWA